MNNKFKLFYFFAFALSLLICFELVFRFFAFAKISNHKNYEKFYDLVSNIDTNTILYLGDSRIEWGVKPILIDSVMKNKSLNLKSINLSMAGSNGLDVLEFLKNSNIKPKIIVLGISKYASIWNNFAIGTIKYSPFIFGYKSILFNLKYNLNKYSYLFDKNSINLILNKQQPFFLNHYYDNSGGVNVVEYGNYNYRKNFQLNYYSGFSKNINEDDIKIYCRKIKEYVEYFCNKKTVMIGLKMPVCDELNELEGNIYFENEIKYAGFMDIIDYQNHTGLFLSDNVIIDSIFYVDGSHLSWEQSKYFSVKLGDYLYNKLNLN